MLHLSPMEVLSRKGRTATVYRVEDGLVCKVPRSNVREQFRVEFDNAFAVEHQLLERLGTHPHIVRYYGLCAVEGTENSLLLGEANRGDLQSYIDSNSGIDDATRQKWSLQIADALAHVHKHGIIHSNLSLTNLLVHSTKHSTDIILADFGGSRCQDLGLDGGLLPDDPFFDPSLTSFDSPKVDVFALGILLYIINTGNHPFHEGPIPENEQRYVYQDYVRKAFDEGRFPDLSGVFFGDIIAGCCCERRYEDANDVVEALKANMNTNALK